MSLLFCPVCNTTADEFLPSGIVPRKNAKCPTCSARERHRLVWLFFQRMTNLFAGSVRSMLHVAPEKTFEPRLKNKLGKAYLTADLYMPNVMVKMDVTDIQFPDEYFDVIYCSHVLEHVVEDRVAIAEFYRVLKNDGWAVLMVPISVDKTIEDAAVTDPKERLRLYGQADHVRRYGPDYLGRLTDAGFKVKVIAPADFMDAEEIVRTAVKAKERIYFCNKQ